MHFKIAATTEKSRTEQKKVAKKTGKQTTKNPSKLCIWVGFFIASVLRDDTFREQKITWNKLKMNAYIWWNREMMKILL